MLRPLAANWRLPLGDMLLRTDKVRGSTPLCSTRQRCEAIDGSREPRSSTTTKSGSTTTSCWQVQVTAGARRMGSRNYSPYHSRGSMTCVHSFRRVPRLTSASPRAWSPDFAKRQQIRGRSSHCAPEFFHIAVLHVSLISNFSASGTTCISQNAGKLVNFPVSRGIVQVPLE